MKMKCKQVGMINYRKSMRKILLFLFAICCPILKAQNCNNGDFETGNTSGWVIKTGTNTMTPCENCATNSGGVYAITTGAQVDPCAGFPVVCPGGNFSVMIGDSIPNFQITEFSQTLLVTPQDTNYTFKYALVIQDPSGHSPTDAQFFEVGLFDSAGVVKDNCWSLTPTGGATACTGTPILKYVFPWTAFYIDLSGKVGTYVTLKYRVGDCTLGNHYAYAFIDGSCTGNYATCGGYSVAVGNTAEINEPSLSSSKRINIFPNPTNDQFYVETNAIGNFSIDLLDLRGNILVRETVSERSSISVVNLDEGVYTAVIKTQGQVAYKKLIIIR